MSIVTGSETGVSLTGDDLLHHVAEIVTARQRLESLEETARQTGRSLLALVGIESLTDLPDDPHSIPADRRVAIGAASWAHYIATHNLTRARENPGPVDLDPRFIGQRVTIVPHAEADAGAITVMGYDPVEGEDDYTAKGTLSQVTGEVTASLDARSGVIELRGVAGIEEPHHYVWVQAINQQGAAQVDVLFQHPEG